MNRQNHPEKSSVQGPALEKVSTLDLDLIAFWCMLTHVAICLSASGIKYTSCQFKTCIFPSASVILSLAGPKVHILE